MKTSTRTAVAMTLGLTTALTILPAGAGDRGYYGDYARGSHHGGGHYSRHHGRHHGDDGVALGAGLIFGMLLGSALQNSYDRRYDEPVYYERAHRPAPAYHYAPEPVYSEPPVTIAERPAGACLQEREYQTTVTVNGRKVQAYGIACLQPDGSWHQGPARLVPQF